VDCATNSRFGEFFAFDERDLLVALLDVVEEIHCQVAVFGLSRARG
jgi:hypothetical protein